MKAGPNGVTVTGPPSRPSELFLACSHEKTSLVSSLKNVHQAPSQSGIRGGAAPKNVCAGHYPRLLYARGLSDGVTVAQGPLEAFVMVRIHVGQPFPLLQMNTPLYHCEDFSH